LNNLWVIITTINAPTLAVKKFDDLSQQHGFNLLLIGDLKTPDSFGDLNATYLSISDQHSLFPKLSALVPTRHYCRKNIGYAYAISKGAEFIFDTDDDNVPLDDFYSLLLSSNASKSISSESKHCNVYSYFTPNKVWPRGLPLDEIRYEGYPVKTIDSYRAPIMQFLADREPDVDAIYRLVDNKPVYFDKIEEGVVLESGTWCPFNSQATLFHKSAFLNLYLPCYVPFRMTDIWRSFVAQMSLWSKGELLSFHQPIVEQYRNEHDFMLDFIDEIEGYKFNKRICDSLDQLLKTGIHEDICLAKGYRSMGESGVIDSREFEIIEEWGSVLGKYL